MRLKRSKQYRKLMQQYGLTFGFREPYQVIIDAQILLDAAGFKMNFVKLLQDTLHGQVKPMITQCSMRHLYATEPKNELVIEHAKAFERRRCNHHELEKPLSTLECLSSVVDAKGNLTNKHCLIIASQDPRVRAHMRTIPGVPIIYLKRSVMILEPMNHATEQIKNREERSKFREGLKKKEPPSASASKRKRTDDDDVKSDDGDPDDASSDAQDGKPNSGSQLAPVKKKRRGPKGPNPLSMKKSKKKDRPDTATALQRLAEEKRKKKEAASDVADKSKAKRRRRRHPGKENSQGGQTETEVRIPTAAVGDAEQGHP